MGNVLAAADTAPGFSSTDTGLLWVVVVIALGALAAGWVLRRGVLAAPEGTERMREIGRASCRERV